MRRLMMRRRHGRTATTADAVQRSRRLRLPTSGAALAVSIVALVVAMAGSAYAGVTLGKGSVGSKQLQKGSVTNGKIAKGAITAGKLKAGLTVPNAVHAKTADSATNATKATSATSATTATNATTAANATALAKVTYIQSASITAPVGGGTVNNPSDTPGSVVCPTGTAAIGGGFTTSGAAVEVNESQPTFANGATKPATGWNGFIDNFGATARTFTVWAICTPVTAGASTTPPAGPIPAPPGR